MPKPASYAHTEPRAVTCCRCGSKIYQGDDYTYPPTGNYAGLFYHQTCAALDPDDGFAGEQIQQRHGTPIEAKPETVAAIERIRGTKITPQTISRITEPAGPTPDPEPEPKKEAASAMRQPTLSQTEPEPAAPAEPEKKKTAAAPAEPDAAGEQLWKLLKPHAERDGLSIDTEAVERTVEQAVKRAEERAREAATTSVVIYEPGKPEPIKKRELVHHRYPALLRKVIRAIKAGEAPNVFAWGPAGTGKSTALGEHLFEDLGEVFSWNGDSLNWTGSLAPQTDPSEFTGWHQVHNGEYFEPAFVTAIQRPGVVFLDEVANMWGPLGTRLQGFLESGDLDTPDGVKKRHPQCVIVAADNTPGMGPTSEFPERNPLPPALRDRFIRLYWGTDEKLERAIAMRFDPSCGPWVDYVQAVRAYIKSNSDLGSTFQVTARASINAAKLGYWADPDERPEDIADDLIFGGLRGCHLREYSEAVKRIEAAVPYPVKS